MNKTNTTKSKALSAKQDVVKKQIALDKALDKNDKATATKLFNEVKGKLTPVHRDILQSKIAKLK